MCVYVDSFKRAVRFRTRSFFFVHLLIISFFFILLLLYDSRLLNNIACHILFKNTNSSFHLNYWKILIKRVSVRVSV
jgi:hypothetical protein